MRLRAAAGARTRRRNGAAAYGRCARPFPDGLGVTRGSVALPSDRRRRSLDERPASRVLDAEDGAAPMSFPAPPKGLRLSDGVSRARSPAKLSELTRPSTTSSASASSTCVRSRPVPSTISSKNDAPCARRWSATACARELSSGSAAAAGTARVHSGALRARQQRHRRRAYRAGMGPLAAAAGVSRVQTARPDRHRSSSQVKS